MHSLKISVVIITRNRSKKIIKTLHSLLSLDYAPTQIIIIDNSSNENTGKAVKTYMRASRIPIIYRKTNVVNKTSMLNHGIRLATGDIVARIDDDETARSDWLSQIATTFIKHRKYLIVCGPLIPDEPDNYWCRQWAELYAELYEYEGEIDRFTGGNVAFRSELFRTYGIYFDETNLTPSEDSHMSYVLRKKHIPIYFSKNIVVMHEFRKTQKAFFFQWFNYAMGDCYQFRHNRDYFALYHTSLYRVCKALGILHLYVVFRQVRSLTKPHSLYSAYGYLVRVAAYISGFLYSQWTHKYRLEVSEDEKKYRIT